MGKSKQRLKFEDALARLEAIVEAMERGDIELEESVARYEEAMALHAQCKAILQDAEQRVQKIQLDAVQGAPPGSPSLTPFEPSREDESEGAG